MERKEQDADLQSTSISSATDNVVAVGIWGSSLESLERGQISLGYINKQRNEHPASVCRSTKVYE